jgi:hypothetical protein
VKSKLSRINGSEAYKLKPKRTGEDGWKRVIHRVGRSESAQGAPHRIASVVPNQARYGAVRL